MFLILFLGIFYGLYTASVYKVAAQDFIDDKALTLAGSIGSVCNGSSRIIWAAFQDRYGFKKVYYILLLLQLAVSASIYSVRQDAVLYTIWVALSFLCEGGHFSMFPAAAAKIFGLTNGGQIYSIMFFANSLSSITSSLFVILGKDHIDPQVLFLTGSAFTAINLFLMTKFSEEKLEPKKKDEDEITPD